LSKQPTVDVTQEEFLQIKEAIQSLINRADEEYAGSTVHVKKLHLSKLLYELSGDVSQRFFKGAQNERYCEAVFRFMLYIAETYCGVEGLTMPVAGCPCPPQKPHPD